MAITIETIRAALDKVAARMPTLEHELNAADGKPVLPTQAPINISLVTDLMEKQPDCRWLCASRRFQAFFMGPRPIKPPLDDTN